MLVDYVAVYSRGGTTPPTTPPPSGGVRDACSTLRAESFDAASAVITETCSEGGQNIGAVANVNWIQFRR